jgi:hypothetical protein
MMLLKASTASATVSAGSFAAALVFILLSAGFAASFYTIFYSAKHVG